MAGGRRLRAVVYTLDTSPAEERLLWSYCGAARKSHNWVIAEVTENLAVRRKERAAGLREEQLTPALSWSARSLSKRWNQVKEEMAPWWREVSMHAFRSGIYSAADALRNWNESKTGKRKGRRVEFPKFKKKGRSTPSISFVELNHQLSWLSPDRHHVRLMLAQSFSDPDLTRRRKHLGWLHTVESTGPLYRQVTAGEVTIQKVTLSYRGGRWRAAFQTRYSEDPIVRSAKLLRPIVGIDMGIRHLATLSVPVTGLTDTEGHVPNPKVLEHHLERLRRLDRQIARAQAGSNSRRRLLRRRARVHGRITRTRALHLHRLTTTLAATFEIVVVEDLNVAGMANRKRHLGRRLSDAGLGEIRRQLTYKTADYGHRLVAVGRFYPSSKTCSCCGAVKAKLPLWRRTFDCDSCGCSFDRDVNAARSIKREGFRLLEGATDHDNHHKQLDGAGLRPESENATPRPRKTGEGSAEPARSPEGGTKQLPPRTVAA